MIHDTLQRASLHESGHPLFAEAFAWLRAYGATAHPGRTVLREGVLYANVDAYETHPFRDDRFEAHRAFFDIQVILSGEEAVYVAPLSVAESVIPYEAARDIEFLRASGRRVMLRPGEFLVLAPEDAHEPGCHPGEVAVPVRKIVLKVLADGSPFHP